MFLDISDAVRALLINIDNNKDEWILTTYKAVNYKRSVYIWRSPITKGRNLSMKVDGIDFPSDNFTWLEKKIIYKVTGSNLNRNFLLDTLNRKLPNYKL